MAANKGAGKRGTQKAAKETTSTTLAKSPTKQKSWGKDREPLRAIRPNCPKIAKLPKAAIHLSQAAPIFL
jgi:hypothetical protein